MNESLEDQPQDQNQYFVDSGTLDPHIPSYVTRPADHELLQDVLNGEFCYVLTARQMGKSSLMVRTAGRLQERRVKTSIVDLTIIGTIPIDPWYLGLLRLIRKELGIRTDVLAWWRERQDLGAPQRFFEFFRDVVLYEVTEPVVIFIDEIDTTLNLEFRDDFFAGIRAMYNARATDPAFNRLTFVLLGVATPTDLIRDQKRTPFNIGTRIELREFRYEGATPLLRGLEAIYPGQGERILRRIFYWTNGHPYLTQKLCLAAVHALVQTWDNARVDGLVHTSFFAEEPRSDSNLTFVQDRIQSTSLPKRRQILILYEAVYNNKSVLNDDRSTVQNDLELFGLVRVEMNRLQVSNQIYRYVFNDSWVSTHMRIDESPLAEEYLSADEATSTDESPDTKEHASPTEITLTDESTLTEALVSAGEVISIDESIPTETQVVAEEQTSADQRTPRNWTVSILIGLAIVVLLIAVIIIWLLPHL